MDKSDKSSKVTIISKDNKTLKIEKKYAFRAALIKQMLEDRF